MQSGVFWGYIDLIDGLVERIKAEYGQPMTVIATGGVASLFEGAARNIDHFDSDITIKGLRILYERNISQVGQRAEMKGAELVFAPARRLPRNRHEPQRLRLRPAREPALDHRRCRRDVRRRHDARRRSHHAGPGLSRRLRRRDRGDHPDARARGPYRRHRLAVAAAARADLCDAVHGLSRRREAARARARGRGAAAHHAAAREAARSARSRSSW